MQQHSRQQEQAGTGFSSVLVGVGVGLVSGAIACFTTVSPALAQLNLIPDTASDRSTNTTVNPATAQIDIIRGGARPQNGINVFHSFQEFNVDEGRGVYFEAPAGVENIFSRVTGTDPSNILGTLGVIDPALNFDDANLFLINPNGIVFGPNASLDVTGSFLATTANAVEFGNGAFFSASNPASSTLLAINPSALFFNAVVAQGIVNQSVATQTVLGAPTAGLLAGVGRSLLLIGGDINLEGGQLTMVNGRIELAGLAGSGQISLAFDPNQIQLVSPENVPLADIRLSQGAQINVIGTTSTIPSGIRLFGDNVTIAEQSLISTIAGTQKGGEIFASTRTLDLQGGAQIFATTSSQGNSGDIQLNAADGITLSDGGFIGTIAANLTPGETTTANSGNIILNTRTLSIRGLPERTTSILSFTFFGRGQAGSLNIAADQITLDRGLLGAVSLSAGQGGNINVQTQDFIARNGSVMSSSTLNPNNLGFGNFSSPFLDPNTTALIQLLLANTPPENLTEFGQANAGNIRLHATNSIRFSDASFILTSTTGQGNAGNIAIEGAESIFLSGGSQIQTSTFGEGQGGRIEITANSIELVGQSLDGQNLTGIASISSDSTATATKRTGDVIISTNRLTIQDGALISLSTSDNGDGGTLWIRDLEDNPIPSTIVISGTQTAADGTIFASGLFASTRGTGAAGTIDLDTDHLRLERGGQIQTSTFGEGQGGRIEITANSIELVGQSPDKKRSSGISSQSNGVHSGRAGDITISTDQLTIRGGALISSSTLGGGDSGRLRIGGIENNNTPSTIVITGTAADANTNGAIFSSGLLASTSGTGAAGTISVDTDHLRLERGGQIQTSTSSTGQAGRIRVRANSVNINDNSNSDRILRSGIASEVLRGATANGGNINLTAEQLQLRGGSFVSTRTFGQGNAGNIRIHAQSLRLNDRAIISAQSQGRGTAGNLTVNVRDRLQLTDSNITTSAPRSSGGDIQVNATRTGDSTPRLDTRGIVLLEGDSDITTNSKDDGGNIAIGGAGIIAFDDSDIVSRSSEERGGDITLSSFFSETNPPGGADDFDGNEQVDLNAAGALESGRINTTDTSPIQNSLSDLPETAVDVNQILANSCIVRTQQSGTFLLTGTGGLPQRPGDLSRSPYSTGEVRGVPVATAAADWQVGDPIVEPQGVYQLPDGRLVMSRECE